MNHYHTLGISNKSTTQQINLRYTILKVNHLLDKSVEKEQKFQEIEKAYNCLSNNDIKYQYDINIENIHIGKSIKNI